jgi:hypothetical protein
LLLLILAGIAKERGSARIRSSVSKQTSPRLLLLSISKQAWLWWLRRVVAEQT